MINVTKDIWYRLEYYPYGYIYNIRKIRSDSCEVYLEISKLISKNPNEEIKIIEDESYILEKSTTICYCRNKDLLLKIAKIRTSERNRTLEDIEKLIKLISENEDGTINEEILKIWKIIDNAFEYRYQMEQEIIEKLQRKKKSEKSH